MKRLKLEVYLNHFVVHVYDRKLWDIVTSFSKSLVSYKFEFNRRFKRMTRVPDKMYCIVHEAKGTVRYPISLLKQMLSTLGYHYAIKLDNIEIIDYSKIETGLPADLQFNDKKYELYDYQEKYVAELSKNKCDVRMVDLLMALGKTVIFAAAACRIGKKIGVIILPKYIEKWLEDFADLIPSTKGRVYVAQGSEGLLSLMNNPEEAKAKYDIFIFPMRTLYNYISVYADDQTERYSNSPYPIPPDKLMQALGIGTVLSDECHQEFYSLFRAMMYFKVDKFIALSATLEHNDKHMQYIYDSLIPPGVRVSKLVEYEPYIRTYAVKYEIANVQKIPCIRSQGYSHIMFEQYAMANTYFLKQYVDMIMHYVEEGYVARRKKGDKLLIFISTVDMCKHIKEVLNKRYAKLDVRTYVQEDEYENIIDADIITSTIISSGTAITIPNLITTIMTIPVGSSQANNQSFGRLRRLKGKETRFYYLYASNFDKHRDLSRKREEAIKDKSLSYTYLRYTPSPTQPELLLK